MDKVEYDLDTSGGMMEVRALLLNSDMIKYLWQKFHF